MSSDADYDYWYALQEALANGLPPPPFYDGRPQCGCYKLWQKDAAPLPVRIFRDHDNIIVLVDGKMSSSPNKAWLACGRNPCSSEEYESRKRDGYWPGGATRGIGDNTEAMPAQDLLPVEIDKALAWLEKLGDLKTKAQADEAANVADNLSRLYTDVEKVHAAEKKPHWDLCKEIDNRYLPDVKRGKEVYTKLKRAIGKFLNQAASAQNARMSSRMSGLQPGHITHIGSIPGSVLGTSGRKLKAKVKLVAKVIDYDKVYQACKNEPEIKALLDKYAQRAADADVNMPGVEMVEEMVV